MLIYVTRGKLKQKQKTYMFRKLVSNLSFSPALITEVGFYARRLRGEEITRRLTVLFVVLALVMQSLAVFTPPESANASSEQDIIRGGVSDMTDFLARYDHNEDDLKDIYSAAGVTRDEIKATQPGTITAKDDTYIMSRFGQLSSSSDEVSLTYMRSVGGVGVRYFSPLASIGGTDAHYTGWIGHSTVLGWFGIVQASASLATHGTPASINPANTATSSATKGIVATNLTESSAGTATAKALDKISYTLKLANTNTRSVTGTFSVRLADVLEYATLIDSGGGSLDDTSGTLSWPAVQLAPGETQERTFAVQLLQELPATATGQSNGASYDCKLSLTFGSVLQTPVDCPAVKGVESVFKQLPTTGIGVNVAFAAVIFIIVAFFYIRTRQLKKEIRIIRHNFNTGII
jgi:hypothetical protein